MKFIKNYLPDVLIFIGAWILSYNFFGGNMTKFEKFKKFNTFNPHTFSKVFATLLIVVAILIIVRKLQANKNKT